MNNPTTAKIETDGTIIQFLMGTHSFNGIWYGQKVSGPSFWWRAELRKYLEAGTKPSTTSLERDEILGEQEVNNDTLKERQKWFDQKRGENRSY